MRPAELRIGCGVNNPGDPDRHGPHPSLRVRQQPSTTQRQRQNENHCTSLFIFLFSVRKVFDGLERSGAWVRFKRVPSAKQARRAYAAQAAAASQKRHGPGAGGRGGDERAQPSLRRVIEKLVDLVHGSLCTDLLIMLPLYEFVGLVQQENCRFYKLRLVFVSFNTP